MRTLVALCILNHVALSGARLALVEQGLRLGVHALVLGLMFAPFALASTLGALPLGRWVDRIGARRPALAGTGHSRAGFRCWDQLLVSAAPRTLARSVVD